MKIELESTLLAILLDKTLSIEEKTHQFELVLSVIRKIREETSVEFKTYREKVTSILFDLGLHVQKVPSPPMESDVMSNLDRMMNSEQATCIQKIRTENSEEFKIYRRIASPYTNWEKIVPLLLPNIESKVTLLMLAAGMGYIDIVRALIRNGAQVDIVDSLGLSALSYAIMCKKLDVVHWLVEAKAELNNLCKSNKSALCWAIEYDQPEVVHCLIEAKADLNKGSPTPLAMALSKQDKQSASLLIRAGALLNDSYSLLVQVINMITESANVTDLHLINLLIERGVNVNSVATDGMTPLMHAASVAHSVVAKRLLQAGANLEATTKSGNTALDFSICHHRHFATALLLAEGASIRDVSVLHRHVNSWSIDLQNDPKFHFCLGVVYELKGKYEEALSHYQKALASHHMPALSRLINLFCLLKKTVTVKSANQLKDKSSSLLDKSSSASLTEMKVMSSPLAERTFDQCFAFIVHYPSVKLTFEQWIFVATNVAVENSHYLKTLSLPARRQLALDAAKNAEKNAITPDEKEIAKTKLLATWSLFRRCSDDDMAKHLGEIITDYSGEKECKKVVSSHLIRR